MKKIKEFVKKIGNKKRCLLSLLLAGLLIFAVLSGLNGSKSAVTDVNAQSALTTKNLDLNGVRYTYQASLNELKNTYGFFKKWYYLDLFRITNNTEGETQIYLNNQTADETLSTEEMNLTSELLEQSFEFYQKELNSDAIKKLDNSISNDVINSTNKTNDLVYTFDNINTFARLKNFSVNFSLLKRIPHFNSYVDDLSSNSFTMNFVYVKDNLDSAELNNIEYMDNNVKFFSYCFSNQVDYYNFELPLISEYSIRNIYLTFEESEMAQEKEILQSVPTEYIFLNKEPWDAFGIAINNVKFIKNSESNIITYNFDFRREEKEQEAEFKGYILLSKNKRDEELIRGMLSGLGPNLTFSFDGGAIFGGDFNNNKLINSFNFYHNLNGGGLKQNVTADIDNDTLFNKNILFTYNDILNTNEGSNTYTYQNQLIYLPKIQNLKATYENKEYSALSAQVEDVLYNVNYIGNIAEEEFNKKVQDDFIDLLKTSGLGAVIGILIGFLVANPVGGLIVGALVGFAVAIVPLILDGLQAIFGYDFLSGLYNFFNAITEFFVNLVDTIINFLLSIITNPFVLVLIVLVAILYIFVIRPKIK